MWVLVLHPSHTTIQYLSQKPWQALPQSFNIPTGSHYGDLWPSFQVSLSPLLASTATTLAISSKYGDKSRDSCGEGFDGGEEVIEAITSWTSWITSLIPLSNKSPQSHVDATIFLASFLRYNNRTALDFCFATFNAGLWERALSTAGSSLNSYSYVHTSYFHNIKSK